MCDVCPRCGIYSEDKTIDSAGPVAICPHCGHRQPFRRRPLVLITGASGAGKSTVCLSLVGTLPGCAVLETDILWCPELNVPEDEWRRFRTLWVRLAKNLAFGGIASVLCGTFVPEGIEALPDRRYLGATHYLALVCDDDVLAERLRQRSAWRQSRDDAFVARMLAFNGWLRANAAHTRPAMALLDTTGRGVEDTIASVRAWVRTRLAEEE